MSGDDFRVTPEQARRELAEALNAIEDKINVPKRVGRATDRARRRFAALADEKPAAAVAGIVGVAGLVGVGVWAVVRSVASR
ncbi:DUF3618 domain-containing protein [Mycetocola reblochoni]|uniref:DUF3618 domain-containing protein n=2 Tax=Mycetocola reblochoni TaxID=331618 RepID=A0A1R4IRM0_9MICO|nr:DUF3618 domain-containing protein [Mycetocola reblochoni]RLP71137.1 DUF3618 domain-containing protein [Mycetocola reblochoni]SJN22540.1 hypothetical protein FM119_03220 [Mycetocola reblochoni REB411]